MNDEEFWILILAIAIFGVLAILVVAATAGNIVNQIFAPIPSVGGPLGAAVALIVFVYLIGKSGVLILENFG